MKKNKNWVICFSGYWNNNSIYGIGQIILKFNQDNYNILWINSIPNRNPSVKLAGSKRVLVLNIFRKVKQHLRFFKIKSKGFYVFTPFYFPFVENPKVYKINLMILKIQVNLLKLVLGIKSYILIASSTIDIPYLFWKKKFNTYIHIVADLYSDYRVVNNLLRQKIKEREKRIFNFADIVLVSSNKLIQKVKGIVKDQRKITYFPHGVDFNHFDIATNYRQNKLKLPYQKPIIGCFGSLSMANDQNVFIALAKAGFSVVLIGTVTGNYSACKKFKNIHFLGPIEYDILPQYAKEFDVAIMAWKPSEWINNSNPKKTYEFLALGKPIVCNSIPEIKHQLSDCVYFADTPERFVMQCKKAYSEDSDILVSLRKEKAKMMDWNYKYLQLKQLINEYI